jgi:hypothetical protein
MTVSATGPVGYPGYGLWIADYSSVGMSRVDVTAPGGDYFAATGTVQDALLAATPIGGEIWNGYRTSFFGHGLVDAFAAASQ